MRPLFRKLVIVGVGLIGGSIGLAARKGRMAETVIGIGPDVRSLKKAVSLHAIDRFESNPQNFKKAVDGADLVVLSVPVGQLEAVADELGPLITGDTTVTDVGSVKGPLVRRLEERFSPPGSFVGGHPIAGKEKSGVEAASARLFSGGLCILTPTPLTSRKALRTVRAFWQGVGAKVVSMEAETHDRILAAVSHLPHVIAYAMVNTVYGLQSGGRDFLTYAAGGFKDFTRIASSSPEMWRDIALANRENLVAAIEAYEKTLARIKRLLIEENAEGLRAEFEQAKDARRKRRLG